MITDVSEENPAFVIKANWKAVLIFIYLHDWYRKFFRNSSTRLADTKSPPKKRELQGHEVCMNIVTVIVKNKMFFLQEKNFQKRLIWMQQYIIHFDTKYVNLMTYEGVQ